MNKLLIENAFDSFLISEAIIKTGNTFVIDGHINEGFYSDEEISEMRDEALNDNSIFSEIIPVAICKVPELIVVAAFRIER